MSFNSTSSKPVLFWFREDLRLADNHGLTQAAAAGPVIPVFILDDKASSQWTYGGASRWWLHHSLESLGRDLEKLGLNLILCRGDSETVLHKVIAETGATAVHWNRRYAPHAIAQDKTIKENLRAQQIDAQSFNGKLLCEPWEIKNGSDLPYKVFTPFWKACMAFMNENPQPTPLPVPTFTPFAKKIASDELKSFDLLPTKPNWAGGFSDWAPGEKGAQIAFNDFMDGSIHHYKSKRDFPGIDATSQLSPHLAFGEISPRQLVHAVRHAMAAGTISNMKEAEHFVTEIGWREFAYHLLVAFPDTVTQPLNPKFAEFPWAHDPAGFDAWEKGRTGYPLIDAGMRQLWQTGWMHNRVRMVVGSFLVKNLLLPWQDGAAWFWDTLVDADLASNTLGWQWVGGCGADAAPYFRIFNPILQSMKFDTEGEYIKKFVPELAHMPSEFIHAPWQAPPLVLHAAGVVLGETYPKPLMDHGFARDRALAALKETR